MGCHVGKKLTMKQVESLVLDESKAQLFDCAQHRPVAVRFLKLNIVGSPSIT